MKVFAGESYNVAVASPDDEEFQLFSGPYVFQHEVETVSPLLPHLWLSGPDRREIFC